MKKFIKKNIVNTFAFVIGIIVSISVVKAITYISGSNVGYSGSLSSDNVQDAIDELYTASKTKKKITAWEYHETGSKKCINGEEDTCLQTDCYKNGSTCSQGTVIKYYVNDNEFRYFYVLRDNGTTITMQQRENTVRNIPWASKYDYVASGGDGAYYDSANDENGMVYGRNDKGPVTILNAIEKATSTWTNVNVLEYTPGTTTLYENAYTGCTYSGGASGTYLTSCGTNIYTLPARKARARMITVLEASSTGCLVVRNDNINNNNYGSCPDFMHNYLYFPLNSSYGGSYSDNTANENSVLSYGYWTISARSDSYAAAWIVFNGGLLSGAGISATGFGARAVVEISK